MKANFPYSLTTTLVYEGGYSNHPKDPGGSTMKGVTQATFNKWLLKHGKPYRDVRTITDAELQAIYKAGYWDTVNGDTLAAGVDLVVFDYAVNSGPGRAQKDLFASVGGSSVDTVKRLCARRLGFLRALRTWSTFGKGWSTRVHSVEAKGIVLASKEAGAYDDGKKALLDAAADSQKVVTKSANPIAATVTAGGGAVATATTVKLSATAWVLIGGLGLVCVAAGAFIVWRMVVQSGRAKVMREAANGL